MVIDPMQRRAWSMPVNSPDMQHGLPASEGNPEVDVDPLRDPLLSILQQMSIDSLQ